MSSLMEAVSNYEYASRLARICAVVHLLAAGLFVVGVFYLRKARRHYEQATRSLKEVLEERSGRLASGETVDE